MAGSAGFDMVKSDMQFEWDARKARVNLQAFGSMTRGKYAERMREASNVVVLDPDIAEVFPNAEIVNQTLRRLPELARSSAQPTA